MCYKISYLTKPQAVKASKQHSKRFGYARYYLCPKCGAYHIASSTYAGEGYVAGKRLNPRISNN